MLEKLQGFGLTGEMLWLIVFILLLIIALYVGRQFIKDSIRELKHVVWPTREETRNYFLIVVATLILFGLYLFVVSTIFTEGLFGLKKLVNSSTESTIDPKAFIDTLEKPTVEVDGVKVDRSDNKKTNTTSASWTTK